jgi:hypothetical protein
VDVYHLPTGDFATTVCHKKYVAERVHGQLIKLTQLIDNCLPLKLPLGEVPKVEDVGDLH